MAIEVKISIIVPVYNAEKYLDACINSIISQEYSNLEIILVNDGSVDNSLQVLNKWKLIDNRITVIDQKNSGVTKARENGYLKSKGDWICFIDSDDIIPTTSISNLVNSIDNQDIVIGHANFNSSTNRFDWPFKAHNRTIESYDYIKYLLFKKIHGGPWARIFKRELFDNNTFNISRLITSGEDLIMNLRLGSKAQYIKQISTVVYTYIDYFHLYDNNTNLRLLKLKEKFKSVQKNHKYLFRIYFYILISQFWDEVIYHKRNLQKTFKR